MRKTYPLNIFTALSASASVAKLTVPNPRDLPSGPTDKGEYLDDALQEFSTYQAQHLLVGWYLPVERDLSSLATVYGMEAEGHVISTGTGDRKERLHDARDTSKKIAYYTTN